MKITGLALSVILIFCICFTGCGAETEQNVSASAGISEASKDNVQTLEFFLNLQPDDISSIDFVRSVTKDGESSLVYKNVTDKNEIQSILQIFNQIGITNIEQEKLSNGWSLMLRFFINDNAKPLNITPYGNDKISLGRYVYAVSSENYFDKLTDCYVKSDAEEKNYIS